MEYSFEKYIKNYLRVKYNDDSEQIYLQSYILQYILKKTQSANQSSKSRGNFANLYAIYVVIEDYINKGYNKNYDYKKYEGARFTDLKKRQCQLPFGKNLQNHALNSRINDDFFKFFPLQKEKGMFPIIRNLNTKRYWINENYLKLKIGIRTIDISQDIIEIIDKYIAIKQQSLNQFINQCKQLQSFKNDENINVIDFIMSLLAVNVDARMFEIVSFAILKYYYINTKVYWGFSLDKIKEENLSLYKTGRTNANDGGIDFVMKPIGRFFQVTETIDFNKYFLDIDKIERYPITFVVKSDESADSLRLRLKKDALQTYVIESIVDEYMSCIEDIINIPFLKNYLNVLIEKDMITNVLDEIIIQSKVEFNYSEELS